MKKYGLCFYIGFFLGLIFFTSCRHGRNSDSFSLFDAQGKGDSLHGVILLPDTAGIGYSFGYVIEGKILMCSTDPRDDYQFYVYRQKGDSLFYENKFMTKGNGPYEMTIPRIKYNINRNTWLIYSLQSYEKEYYEIELKDFDNIYNVNNWVKKEFPAINSRVCMEFLNDSVYVNVCYNGTDNLFSLTYAGRDNYYKPLDFPYPTQMQDLHPSTRSLIYSGILLKHPNRPTFLYSCKNSKYILIFDIENEEIKNIRYLSSLYPEYTVTDQNPYQPYYFNDNVEKGCYIVDVTGRYIYIGYNNITRKEIREKKKFKGYPYDYFDRVNVFDWDGNFIRRLVLDQPIAYFNISRDGRYLYALLENPENEKYQTVRFKL